MAPRPPGGAGHIERGRTSRRFALWEDRPYFKTGRHFEAAEARPRGHVGGEAGASHWRSPRRVSTGGVRVPSPVLASRVALRAVWDEYDAAEVTPEPPRHGQWDRDFRKREKDAYWARSDRLHRWADLPNRDASARLELAEPSSPLWYRAFSRSSGSGGETGGGERRMPASPCRALNCSSTASSGALTTTQLHAWDEPAVRWPGGPEYWFWQGLRIWRELVEGRRG